MAAWPIRFEDVVQAEARIRPYLPPTALRRYGPLDDAVSDEIAVWVKHENHNPTNSFKARNALSVMTALSADERRRGVVAATRGNHGAGLAWAGGLLGVPVTVCVPVGNNPEKNAAMRGYGAHLIEEGKDYDAALAVSRRLVSESGLRLVHSTNDADVIAGAGTMSLEILREKPVDALVIAVGGGSQAVGALTVARKLRPDMPVYAVQAAKASAIHDSWHAGSALELPSADTFADGLATRATYAMTFEALREGLAGFVVVSEAEIAHALRLLIKTTHNLAEGAGAVGLAGLLALRPKLAGKSVAIVISGSNIDADTLRRVMCEEL